MGLRAQTGFHLLRATDGHAATASGASEAEGTAAASCRVALAPAATDGAESARRGLWAKVDAGARSVMGRSDTTG